MSQCFWDCEIAREKTLCSLVSLKHEWESSITNRSWEQASCITLTSFMHAYSTSATKNTHKPFCQARSITSVLHYCTTDNGIAVSIPAVGILSGRVVGMRNKLGTLTFSTMWRRLSHHTVLKIYPVQTIKKWWSRPQHNTWSEKIELVVSAKQGANIFNVTVFPFPRLFVVKLANFFESIS